MTDLRKALAQPNADEGVDGSVRIYIKRNGTFEQVDTVEKALELSREMHTAPPKREQWTPVEIGVDVTLEGAHVVGMYVLMPEAVRHVFYSQFHPAPKREWVGLTDEERVQAFVGAGLELAYMDYDADMKISKVIEAKLKEKNT